MPPDVTQPPQKPPETAPAAEPRARRCCRARPSRPARETSRLHRLLTVGGTILGLFIALPDPHLFRRLHRRCLCALRPRRRGAGGDGPDHRGPCRRQPGRQEGRHALHDRSRALPARSSTSARPQIDEQTALVKVAAGGTVARPRRRWQASTSAHTYAEQQQIRYADLAKSEYAPRAELDKANDDLRRTAGRDDDLRQSAIDKAQTDIVRAPGGARTGQGATWRRRNGR